MYVGVSCEKKTSLSRREFLRAIGLGVTAGILVSIGPEDLRSNPVEHDIRNLDRNALIIAGGKNEKTNHFAYWVDAVLWYQTARDILAIPDENITLLYFDGKTPSKQGLFSSVTTNKAEKNLALLLDRIPPEKIAIDGPADKENILNQLAACTSSEHSKDQTLIFRSGEGIIDIGGLTDSDDKIHSIMLLPKNEKIYDTEFFDILGKNTSTAIMTFLMQCHSAYFLDRAGTVSNLAIFTSNGEGLKGEESVIDQRKGIEWPWSMAMRQAIINPKQNDQDRDGKINLSELQGCILINDYMAVKGIYNVRAEEYRKTHPGFAYGSDVDPNEVSILQYRYVLL